MYIKTLEFEQVKSIYHILTFERLKNECDRPLTSINCSVTKKIKSLERKFQKQIESTRRSDGVININLTVDETMFVMDMIEQYKYDMLLLGEYEAKDLLYIDTLLATINLSSYINDEGRRVMYADL